MYLEKRKSFFLLPLVLFPFQLFGSDTAPHNKSNETNITVNVDITDASAKGCKLYNVWSVANRISPENGVDVRDGLSVNLIRMLGGILKDKKPYYGYDVCKYNSVANSYEYDFTPLFSRLDKVLYSSTPIQEIVLDQPDWAFQNGYKFVNGDKHDGTNFNDNQRQSIYGNSLPPSDNKAYYNLIKEVINQLVSRYGQTIVLSWQFRIGSEIETPDHWYGTKQEFIDHYINMTNAMRSILPDAKIGTHTRDYDFVYRKKDFRNYKGEQVKSFAKDMLKQLSDNSIKYNFWGVTDYVVTSDEKSRDIKSKYDVIFSKFINDSHWIKNTPIDIMEYSPIVTMSGADKKGYINCVTTHSSIIDISLAHQFYKYHDKGLRYIYRWGQKSGTGEVDYINIINSMNGMQSVNANIIGQAKNNGDIIDAITGVNDGKIDLLVYNYNSKSFDYQPNNEKVNVNITTDFPLGTILKYKILSYDKSNNKLNKFLDKYGDKYIKKDFDKLGDPLRTLTPEGLELYKKMPDPKPFIDGEWKDVKTIKCDERNKSVIELTIDMPSFSYKKIEIRKDCV